MMFEEHLHGARITAVRAAILNGQGFRNDLLRRHLGRSWAAPFIRDEILKSGYLDQRNPVTIGPVLDAPEEDQAADGRFVEERLRDVLFGLVLAAAEAELWEPRADWPSGELAWFEVARLGLRESPS